jgi:hypothetical protein
MRIQNRFNILLIAAITGAMASLPANSLTLPKPDKRWQVLIPGVHFDSETFKVITVDGSKNDGKRWTQIWIRYIDNNSSELKLAYWGSFCNDRDAQLTKIVTIDSNGKETTWEGYYKVPLHPDSNWEPIFNEVCKRSKQWWKVW